MHHCSSAPVSNSTHFLCVSVCALSSSNHRNQFNRFFFPFVLRGHGWFVSAWHTDASITHSTQPCQHCLWPSGRFISHTSHYWPSSCVSGASSLSLLRHLFLTFFYKQFCSPTLSFCHLEYFYPTLYHAQHDAQENFPHFTNATAITHSSPWHNSP